MPTLILRSGRVDGHLAQRGHETTGLATRGTDGYCEPEFSGGHRINDRRARGDKASVAQARDGRGVLHARRAPTGAGSNDARPSARLADEVPAAASAGEPCPVCATPRLAAARF